MLSAGPRLVSGFTPLNLTNLVGFWRADQGITLGGGSTAVGWTDRSSNNTLLTVVAGSSAPVFGATAFNGSFPGVTFTGVSTVSQQSLYNAAFSFTSAAISVFALVNLAATQAADAGLVSFVKSPPTNDNSAGNFVVALAHLGTQGTFLPYSNGGIGDGGSLTIPFSPNLCMLGFTVSPSGAGNAWVNGVVVGSATAGTASFGSNPNSIQIGGRTILDPVLYPLNATVAFWGITAAEMNSSDWINLKNWANANWGTSF